MSARQFYTSPTKVINVFDTLGQMKKLPFTDAICIDEFYWNRKSKNKYACVIVDFKTSNIIDIIEGRKLKNWDSYTQLINKKELHSVKYICTDLFETYRQVQKIYFPHALLCCDSFHIIKNINILLKNERIKIMKKHDIIFSRMRNRIMFSLNKNSLPSSLEQSQIIKKSGRKRGKYKKVK